MTLYRRGSVTVEAVPVIDLIKQGDLPDWVTAAIIDGRIVRHPTYVDVQTIEGWSTADAKSWVIRRQTEHGELYPIPDKRFTDPKAGYTRVE